MKKIILKSVLFSTIFLCVALYCNGQTYIDTVPLEYKNNVRVNVTNPMIFGDKYTVVGYERKIKDYQTASVNMGRFSLPKWNSFNNDSIGMSSDYNDNGFTMAFDYRFYLKNENKYKAPHGIYIGPYYSFNYLHRVNHWELNTSNYHGMVDSEMKFKANLVGFQLGYQFVLWKRLSLDMILFGPGIWYYNMKIDLNTDLAPDEIELIYEKLNEAITEKLPGNELLVPSSNYQKKGSYSTSSGGYRLMIHLGFLF